MDINPEDLAPLSDEDKIEITSDRLWSVYNYMIDEYSINQEDFASGLKLFKEQLCDLWNEEDDDE